MCVQSLPVSALILPGERSDLNLILEEFVDLVDEGGLRLGDFALDVHDLLADELVDRFHVLKHLVSLLIQGLKLLLILLQLLLLLRDQRLAVVPL